MRIFGRHDGRDCLRLFSSWVLPLALGSLLAPQAFAQVVVRPGETPPSVEPQTPSSGAKYIVQFLKETPPQSRASIARQAGATVRRELGIIDALAVELGNAQALSALMNNPNVLRVVPDHPLREAVPPKTAPPAPVGLAATAISSSRIDLVWQEGPNSGEAGFRIERCLGSGCTNFNAVGTVGANTTSFSDTGLAADTVYAYQVIGFITSGPQSGRDSQPSEPATAQTHSASPTPPAAPSNLTAAALDESRIAVSWADNSGDEDGFTVERCEGGGCATFAVVATLGANVQSFEDGALAAETTYRYRVQASNANGVSGYSNEDEATTFGVAPPEMSFGGTRQIISPSVQRVGPPDAYSDGTGQGVAVLDSGCDYNHRDLECTAMTDYFGGSGQDDRGHGTHVIGLIAAKNNNFDVVGVAPEAQVFSYKTMDASGNGDESNFAAAINDVVANQAQFPVPVEVINISAGRPLQAGELMEDTPMCQAAAAARAAGIVVVVSAGNSPDLEISDITPAGCAAVIPVAATVAEDGISTCGPDYYNSVYPTVMADSASNFTTDGVGVISAPGESRDDTVPGCSFFLYGTLSTTWQGAQGILNPDDPNDPPGASRKLPIPLPEGAKEARGTSFAAPLVAGIVLRMKQVGIGGGTGDAAEVEAIRTELFSTADRSGAANDPDAAPLRHPWADLDTPWFSQTFDGVKEGIAQAPKAP